ncbi:MAG: hypothetical protein FJ388_18205, partial [Verrucomicrobia bacterium]|nr:hypothetical protein [Verrucomicrobiota bacterium]
MHGIDRRFQSHPFGNASVMQGGQETFAELNNSAKVFSAASDPSWHARPTRLLAYSAFRSSQLTPQGDLGSVLSLATHECLARSLVLQPSGDAGQETTRACICICFRVQPDPRSSRNLRVFARADCHRLALMKLRSGWLRLSLLLPGIILYGAAVWETRWSTVDDAMFLRLKLEFHQQWADGQLSPKLVTGGQAGGRFIPGFCVAQFIEHELFGLECWKHHLFHLVVMLAVCQVLFSVTARATGSPGAAWLTGLLFLCFSPNVENWARLDLQEFYQMALLLPSLWCMVVAMGAPSERRL